MRLLFTLSLLLLTTTVYSQSKNPNFDLRFLLGANFVFADSQDDEYFEVYPEHITQAGVAAGINFRWNVNSYLFVELETAIRQERIRFNNYTIYKFGYGYVDNSEEPRSVLHREFRGDRSINNFLLSVPLIIGLKPFKNKSFELQLGVGVHAASIDNNDNIGNSISIENYHLNGGAFNSSFDELPHYYTLHTPRIVSRLGPDSINIYKQNQFFGFGLMAIEYQLNKWGRWNPSLGFRYKTSLAANNRELFVDIAEDGYLEIVVKFFDLL